MKLLTKDTVNLLQECSSGVKMAVSAIDGVVEDVKSDTLKAFMIGSKARHSAIGKEIDALLEQNDDRGKEPPAMAKMMSRMKINFKMSTKPSDKEAASLVYDGCNMGIKSLYEYLNNYTDADEQSRDIAHRIINEEEELKSCLRNFV